MSEVITLTKVAGLLRSGVSLDKSLERAEINKAQSKGIQFFLAVARDSGSSMVSEIEFVADVLASRDRAMQKIAIAHASPKSTAKLMLWLPIITLGMAQLLGWGVLDTLLEKPIVLMSLGLGLVLLLSAKLVTTRLLKKAKPEQSYEGFYLLGVAMQLSAGANLVRAQDRALTNYREVLGTEPPASELLVVAEIVELVEHSGAKAIELLRKQAQIMQEEVLFATEVKIEKLGIKLMLPLGLGVLPAFVFLAIVPLMVTTLGAQ
jgi:tight adherence protein B